MTDDDDDRHQHTEVTDHSEVFGPIDAGILRAIRVAISGTTVLLSGRRRSFVR